MSTTETKVRLQGGDILTVWTSETRDEARARINADVVRLIVESHADMLEALEDALALIENGLEMMDKEPLEVAAAAREAIAKAKGGAA